jgi:hypothetical protein
MQTATTQSTRQAVRDLMHEEQLGYERWPEYQINEHLDQLDLAMRALQAQGNDELARAVYRAAQVARRDRRLMCEYGLYAR